jgi:beta-phosphoglucomutase
MNLKACLFDLDGVLVDTARFHYLAWKNLAEKLGFEFTETDNERLKGVSRMASLEILLEIGNYKATEEEKIKFATEKNDLYLTYIKKMVPGDVLPGVREFLTEIRKKNIRTALGSVSKNAGVILQRTDLNSLFDAIVDGNLVTNAKPDPEVFLKGAEMVQADPASCLVFEDAIAGVEAAHRAGMKCIGVGSPDILQHADQVIPGFKNVTLNDLKIQ